MGLFFMTKKHMTFWRLWAKALGEKAGKNDKESDNIAIIRTIIFFSYLTTNAAIVANAVRHWDDNQKPNYLDSPLVAIPYCPMDSEETGSIRSQLRLPSGRI